MISSGALLTNDALEKVKNYSMRPKIVTFLIKQQSNADTLECIHTKKNTVKKYGAKNKVITFMDV